MYKEGVCFSSCPRLGISEELSIKVSRVQQFCFLLLFGLARKLAPCFKKPIILAIVITLLLVLRQKHFYLASNPSFISPYETVRRPCCVFSMQHCILVYTYRTFSLVFRDHNTRTESHAVMNVRRTLHRVMKYSWYFSEYFFFNEM